MAQRQQTTDAGFEKGDIVRVIAFGGQGVPVGFIGKVHGISETPTHHPLVDFDGYGRYLIPARCLEPCDGPLPTVETPTPERVPLRAEPPPREQAPEPEPPAVDWCEPAEAWVRPRPATIEVPPIAGARDARGEPTAERSTGIDERRARISQGMRESHARRRAGREQAGRAEPTPIREEAPTETPPTLHDLAALLGQAIEMTRVIAARARESA